MGIQLTLALRYLQGRKLRTTLTTLAVIFGVMILFGLNSLMPAIMQAFQQDVLTITGTVDLTVTHASGGAFAVDQVTALGQVDGVVHSTGILRQSITLPPRLTRSASSGTAVGSVILVGVDPATIQKVRAQQIVNGRFLNAGDSAAIVMPESLARKMGMVVGDKLTLPSAEGTADFTLVGIVATRPTVGTEEVYVPLAAAQRLLNQPGRVNMAEAIFAAGADRATVEAAVRARLGDSFRLGEATGEQSIFADAVALGGGMMMILGVLTLAMGCFIIFNTFRTVVAERRRDLGMLRALGARRRTIMGLILTESLIQGVLGTALGLVAGYGLIVLIIAFLQPIAQEIWRRDFMLPPVTVSNLLLAIVLGLSTTLLGGLLPAISAMRVAPLDALRPSTPAVEKRRLQRRDIVGGALIVLAILSLMTGNVKLASLGALLFLAGLVLLAPALVRPLASVFGSLLDVAFAREGYIARGNLTRQPGRAAVTASAVMIALAIMVSVGGLMSSILTDIAGYGDKSLGSDYLIMPTSLVLSSGNLGAAPALAEKMRATQGIAVVSTLRLSSTTVGDKALQVIGIDPATYAKISGLVFSAGDENEAYAALAAGRAVVINGIFAAQNQVKVGDVLPMQTPEGLQQYRVVGIGLDLLNAKVATAYISQANLERDFHQTSDLLLMANRTPGADAGAVRSALEALVAGYPVFTLLDAASFRDQMQQTYSAMSVGLYVFLIVLAVPGLLAMINTLAINVIERTREIGTLRAVGSTRRQVGRLIRAESLLLAALGTAFGILAGLWLGYVFVGAINVSGFVITYSFPWAGVLFAIAAGLLLGVAAASIPARQAARLNIVEALRYE
jgi:putative ABC transport system permease protein